MVLFDFFSQVLLRLLLHRFERITFGLGQIFVFVYFQNVIYSWNLKRFFYIVYGGDMDWTLIGVDEFICSSSLLFTTTTLQTFVEKQIRTSS